MSKYYAVRKGRTTGIFFNWEDCRIQVYGFPGAEYKSFKTSEEAIAWIEGNESMNKKPDKAKKIAKKTDVVEDNIELIYPLAFTDGSFNEADGIYGWGGFIMESGKLEYSLDDLQEHLASADDVKIVQGSGNDEAYLVSRNISGEIFAVLKVLEKAIELGLDSIHIYYDCKILEELDPSKGDKQWNPTTDVTKYYVKQLDIHRQKIKIIFHKVKAHSKIPGNEIADVLAKQAAGIIE